MQKTTETKPETTDKKSKVEQAETEKRSRESGKHFQAQGTEKQG